MSEGPASTSASSPMSDRAPGWLCWLLGHAPQATSAVAIAAGILVLCGWAFDLSLLKSAFSGLTAMKANTALGFLLAGISLWNASTAVRPAWTRIASQTCAAIVLLLGLLNAGEYLSGRNFGIDQLVVRDITNLPGDIPGRMAPNTAASFSALGAALLLLNRKQADFVLTIHGLAIGLILVAGAALVSYGYDIDAFLRAKLNYTPMALHTATVFVLLGLGVLNARPDYPFRRIMTSESTAGSTARRLWPAAIGLQLLMGWLLLIGLEAGQLSEAAGLALFAVTNMAGLSALIHWNAARLYQADAERLQTETALKGSERQYRTLVNNLHEGIWAIDKDTRTAFVNPRMAEMLGYTVEEMLGKHLYEFLDERAREIVSPHIERRQRGIKEQYELDFLRKDGTRIYASLVAAPILDDHGNYTGALAGITDITERKRFEEALRESEERYRTLFESIDEGFCIIEVLFDAHEKPVDYRLLIVNPAFERQTGIFNAFGRGRREIAPMQGEQWFEIFGEIALRGEPRRFETPLGQLHRYYDVYAFRIGEPKEKKVAILFNDITERKRTEAALKEAQRIAHLGSWELDMDKRHVRWSEELFRIFGLPPREQPWPLSAAMEAVPPPDRELVATALDACWRTGAPYDVEYRIVQPDGSVRWLHDRGEVVADEKGKAARILGTSIDTTDRKKAEEKLQAASQYARSLIEASLDPFVTISPEGKITDVNHATEEITGASRETLIGSDFSDYFTDPDRARAGYREVFSKGFVTDYPLAICHVSGKVTEVLYSARVYRDDRGDVAGVFAAARDVTERRRAERKMTATVAELKRREHEMLLIHRMNDLLQSCQVLAEGYQLISFSAQALFEGLSGGLAIFDDSNQVLDTVAQWGDEQILQPVFTLDECWALRAGRSHRTEEPRQGLLCHHFSRQPPGGYIDLPLLVLGEVLGVLHLNAAAGRTIDAAQEALAGTFAEVAKLALSNLKLRDALREQAIRDPLTKLYNRRYLDETLARELHRAVRSETSLCVAMLDIDHFKDFNNEYGHEAGDLVLELIGSTLRQKLRASDLACRYGGEEFTVILLDTEYAVAKQRMEQICLEVKQRPQPYHETSLPTVTLSVGIAQAPLHGSDPQVLLRSADNALYAAKRGGRDRVEVFQPT